MSFLSGLKRFSSRNYPPPSQEVRFVRGQTRKEKGRLATAFLSRFHIMLRSRCRCSVVRKLRASQIPEYPNTGTVSFLGDDRFLQSLSASVVRKRGHGSLQLLAAEVCNRHGIAIEQLSSCSRLPHIVRARDEFIQHALDQPLATTTKLARFLNRSAAAVSRAAARRSS